MRSQEMGWTPWLILGSTKAFPGHLLVDPAAGFGQDFGG